MTHAPTHPTALITGASGGLGLELAGLFARDGYNLILVARRIDKLRAAASDLSSKHGILVEVLPCDLSEIGAGQKLVDDLQARGLTVDALVNNAGYADYGKFVEASLEKQLNMVDLNIRTLTELTGLLLPGMVQRGRGKIMNIASTAAFQPGPLMSVYYASKAYVLFFSEAIANELEGSGVSVTAFCPGAFESGFQGRAEMGESKLVKGRKLPTSGEMAQIGYAALIKGQAVSIGGRGNYLQAQSVRFLPRGIVTKVVRSISERGH